MSHCVTFIVWELEVHGTRHTVGLSLVKLQRLCLRTEAMLRHGSASGLDMAVLLGHWTWALLVQRPAFAIFNAIYRFVLVAGPRRFSIWRTVRRELEIVVALAPLLQASIGAPWHHKIVASDSSSTGLGVVAASADEPHLLAIINSSYLRPWWTSLAGRPLLRQLGGTPNTSTSWSFAHC